ncbi:hypothetical protein LDENG_00196260 [Lucifuga dentata]|nr:hypothetical protein LDENG_00196260 [Lucifuga dentata]
MGSLSNNIKKEARNLGVIFDSNLSFDAQVTRVTQSCFFQRRQITKIKSFLNFKDVEKVIHAFISSRLDYCNALYSGISKRNIHRLQLIQNAAARVLTRSRRSDHITPVLGDLLTLYKPDRCLRSSDRNLLVVPKSRLVTKGDRAFAIHAPRLWNSLPEDLRLAHSVSFFKTGLKTYFYCMAFL